MMLDLRRFGNSKTELSPITQLPLPWREFLRDIPLAGVILFAENICSVEQCIGLTESLRQASANPSMLIGIDQEGGRVMRTPRGLCTDFGGPMSLGAAATAGQSLSQSVAEAMGLELQALGINLNFAPTVDVNSNPNNPVINVRAFGESVDLVCREGGAFVAGLQTSGVGAALKHFPGHGDTHTDSHIGLARVDRSVDDAFAIDIAPYREVIARHNPAAVMTAHIQYPSLDNSEITASSGEVITRPATLSREILSDLLRTQLGFSGVIITDALDMGAIAENFDLVQAALQSLAAGADILLMPFRIECPADFSRFDRFLDELVAGVAAFPSIEREMFASLSRIKSLEAKYPPLRQTSRVIKCPEHLQLEERLAQQSICAIGEGHLRRGHQVIVSGNSKSLAASVAVELRQKGFDCLVKPRKALSDYLSHQLVWVELNPSDAAVDWGGVDFYSEDHSDLGQLADHGEAPSLDQDPECELDLTELLARNLNAGGQNWFLAMRSPYINPRLVSVATVLFAFHYSSAVERPMNRAVSPVYRTLAEILCGERKAAGSLPVSVS